ASSNSRSVVANIDNRITVSAITKNQTARVVFIQRGASLRLANLHFQSDRDDWRKGSAPTFAPLFSRSVQIIPAGATLRRRPATASQSRRLANARRDKFANNRQLPR